MANVAVLGDPYAKMTCPTHKQIVSLNKRGECPYCYNHAMSGGRSTGLPQNRQKKEACPKCKDTRRPGKNGCLGCYAKQRQSECASDYVKRGIATAMEVEPTYGAATGLVPYAGIDFRKHLKNPPADARPANERFPAFDIALDAPALPEPSPQLEMDFEEPTCLEGEYIPAGVSETEMDKEVTAYLSELVEACQLLGVIPDDVNTQRSCYQQESEIPVIFDDNGVRRA